jgi:hypothetical protein
MRLRSLLLLLYLLSWLSAPMYASSSADPARTCSAQNAWGIDLFDLQDEQIVHLVRASGDQVF